MCSFSNMGWPLFCFVQQLYLGARKSKTLRGEPLAERTTRFAPEKKMKECDLSYRKKSYYSFSPQPYCLSLPDVTATQLPLWTKAVIQPPLYRMLLIQALRPRHTQTSSLHPCFQKRVFPNMRSYWLPAALLPATLLFIFRVINIVMTAKTRYTGINYN